MPILKRISNRLARSFRSSVGHPKSGWFGVDIGTAAVKIARLERAGDGYRAATMVVIPTATEGRLDEQKLRDGSLLRVLNTSLTESFGFGQQQAACLLPMSTVDYRCLQLPAAADDVVQQMARQEMEEENPTETTGRVMDVWRGATEAQDTDAMQEVAVLSADESMVTAVAHDLAKARLRCRAVDGLPFALARAAGLALPDQQDTPLAVVDWGQQSVTLTVARGDYPWFTRVLPCRGAGQLVQRLGGRLGLDEAECWQLLSVYGVGGPGSAAGTGDLVQAIEQDATPAIQSVAREIRTTLDYLQHRQGDLCPRQILLTGGGATISGVAGRIEDIVGLKTDPWQLGGIPRDGRQPADATPAMFAAAMALSALGLEA